MVLDGDRVGAPVTMEDIMSSIPLAQIRLKRVVNVLAAAGETELADKINAHSEARARGADLEELKDIWLQRS